MPAHLTCLLRNLYAGQEATVMEWEVGGGIGMGNTCKPMPVSFQCMTKSTTIKNNNNNLKKTGKEKKKKQQNGTQNNGLVQNWERSTSGVYIVTLLFNLYAEYIM